MNIVTPPKEGDKNRYKALQINSDSDDNGSVTKEPVEGTAMTNNHLADALTEDFRSDKLVQLIARNHQNEDNSSVSSDGTMSSTSGTTTKSTLTITELK